MKLICIFCAFLGLVACGDEQPKSSKPENNILLKKQDEIQGKAIRNANKLLESDQNKLKEIDGQ